MRGDSDLKCFWRTARRYALVSSSRAAPIHLNASPTTSAFDFSEHTIVSNATITVDPYERIRISRVREKLELVPSSKLSSAAALTIIDTNRGIRSFVSDSPVIFRLRYTGKSSTFVALWRSGRQVRRDANPWPLPKFVTADSILHPSGTVCETFAVSEFTPHLPLRQFLGPCPPIHQKSRQVFPAVRVVKIQVEY